MVLFVEIYYLQTGHPKQTFNSIAYKRFKQISNIPHNQGLMPTEMVVFMSVDMLHIFSDILY